MIKYMKITEARNNLTAINRELSVDEGTIAITTRGIPSLALMSWALYESMMETFEIINDKDLMADISMALDDVKKDRLVSLEEIKKRYAVSD